MKKIVIVGTGYVGLSTAVLLAQYNDVTAVDADAKKVEMINAGISPIRDVDLVSWLREKPLTLTAVTDAD